MLEEGAAVACVIWVEDREQVCRLISGFVDAQGSGVLQQEGCKRVCVISDGKVRTFGGLWVESGTGAKH